MPRCIDVIVDEKCRAVLTLSVLDFFLSVSSILPVMSRMRQKSPMFLIPSVLNSHYNTVTGYYLDAYRFCQEVYVREKLLKSL